MGLFDMFKKKETPAPQPVAPSKPKNNPNSVFTMQFVVPYFKIFDKTNPRLKSLPIDMAVAGSVSYRISEPDLCFNNVPLGEMSPKELEEHVKDALTATVKAFILSIETIPLLQFESAIMKINDAARGYLVPKFDAEYGIQLRMFSLSRFTYDEENPNYLALQRMSQEALEQDITAQEKEADLKLDLADAEHDARLSDIQMETERKRAEYERQQRRSDAEMDASLSDIQLETERKRAQYDREQRGIDADIQFENERKRAEFAREQRKSDAEANADTIEFERRRAEFQREQRAHDMELDQQKATFEQEMRLKEDAARADVESKKAAASLSKTLESTSPSLGSNFLNDNEFKIEGL